MLNSEITQLDDIAEGERIYVAPGGAAAARFVELLGRTRTDIEVIGFLDSFRSGYYCEKPLTRIDQINKSENAHRVVVVIERKRIREQIANLLVDAGFMQIDWVGHRFSLKHTAAVQHDTATLYFYYDLSVNALNYEYLISLCHADAERKRLGLDRLHTIIVPPAIGAIFDLSRNPTRRKETTLEDGSHWFLHNVVMPLNAMVPSCEAVTLCATRAETRKIADSISLCRFPSDYDLDDPHELDSIRRINDPSRYDGNSYGQPLRSSETALAFVKQWLRNHKIEPEKAVCISLRSNGVQEGRNSDINTWKQVAEGICERGYTPVFIKDTYSDFEPDDIKGHHIFHAASWNIQLRMAMYELAYLNMTVNTGTMMLCVLNPAVRYLAFIYVSEDDYVGSKEFHETSGTPIGSQYPAAGPLQLWVWGGTGNSATILREFDAMCSRIAHSNTSRIHGMEK